MESGKREKSIEPTARIVAVTPGLSCESAICKDGWENGWSYLFAECAAVSVGQCSRCYPVSEKFATLEGEPIYLFLVSQGELVWHAEWLQQANEAAFEPAIAKFLTGINQESSCQYLLHTSHR